MSQSGHILYIYTSLPMEEICYGMAYKKVAEIAVGLEINSYASAEV